MSAGSPELLQLVVVDAGAAGLGQLLASPAWAAARVYEAADGTSRRLVVRALPADGNPRAAAAETAALRRGSPTAVDNVYRRILLAPDDGGPFFTGGPLSVVMIDMAPERERAMNEWYDSSHVPNLLTVPGYRVASRYRLVPPEEREHAMGPEYLALYELESAESIPLIGPEPALMTPEAVAELAIFRRDWAPATRNLDWAVYRPRPAAT